MMAGLRAEDVKEAIPVVAMALQQGGVQGCDEFDAGLKVLAAAREWLAAQEQTPDYEGHER